MRILTISALQLELNRADEGENIDAVCALIEQAASEGADIALPPELFAGPYFCREELDEHFALARSVQESPSVQAMQNLAKSLKITIPTSFFERDGHHYYNTVAFVGPDGEIMGTYRKSHIPDGPGYEEKFYFRPGNDGFKVWDVPIRGGQSACIGLGVCWDQWYPETARCLALKGAEALLFPTAIGSEPKDAGLDTSRMWRRAMIGHAVSNCMPVIAANRIGHEGPAETGNAFYGHSFIVDQWGDMLSEYGAQEAGILTAKLDLEAARKHRASWGFFRDRRPELYERIGKDI